MKFLNLILIILIIFNKTGNLLSQEGIFYVNNIPILKEKNVSNKKTADKAIKDGFEILKEKIILENDKKILNSLSLRQIKDLVAYYQIDESNDENDNKIYFNILFDKKKIHNLFFQKNISYSEIIDKEVYLLPILEVDGQFYIFNKNIFYEKWNKIYDDDLIEFILPQENIEIIQIINKNKNNILDLDINELFKEYSGKNLSLIIIQKQNENEKKVFLRSQILGKNVDKNLIFKNIFDNQEEFFDNIIALIKKDLTNTIKSLNLVDIKTPSFLNTQFTLNKNNNLAELNKRLKKIESIENIIVQKFNNKNIFLKIKYLGKLDKIIQQLEKEKIILKLIGDQWSIKLI